VKVSRTTRRLRNAIVFAAARGAALDAATGHGQDDRDDAATPDPVATDQPAGKKHVLSRLAVFFEGVLSNALGGILATFIVALAVFLWAHFHASPPAHHPPARPAATATTSR
jgi:hypothetical protein